ncbi:hypothetical protein [uncultured Aliivibrio sp.]|uniref:hypothetical protein n=1 Tax=uncultured Aliivibrio sp. TaxID=873085 RepID=UPI0026244F1B|nr:hypothetical protein [uncultured Aliivibrio sp.]
MKGWTVKTKATKNRSDGIAAREIYLHNKNAESHKKTEVIGRVWGNDNTMATIAYNGTSAAAKLKAKGKGGRPAESFAMEFTLNLPKGYRPSGEQWKAIAKQMFIDVAAKLGTSAETISKQTYAVVHRQDQTLEYDSMGREVGTGDHMHVVIGKFTPEGSCLRDLQRKTITHVVKDSFNNSTMKMGLDWTQYRDHKLQAQEHANKRTVPTWKIKAARELEIIATQQAALDKQAALLSEQAKELEARENQLLTDADDIMLTKRLMTTFENQVAKWLDAHEKHDVKQLNRQANRLNKSLVALDALGLLSEDPATLEAAMIMSSITKYIDKITAKNPDALRRDRMNLMRH